MYLSGLPQNHISQSLTFVNPAADWRIVVQCVYICAVCISTPNHIFLTLYDIINFNDITSALSSYKYGKNITFTGV